MGRRSCCQVSPVRESFAATEPAARRSIRLTAAVFAPPLGNARTRDHMVVVP